MIYPIQMSVYYNNIFENYILNRKCQSVDEIAIRWTHSANRQLEHKFAIVNLQHENLLTI